MKTADGWVLVIAELQPLSVARRDRDDVPAPVVNGRAEASSSITHFRLNGSTPSRETASSSISSARIFAHRPEICRRTALRRTHRDGFLALTAVG
jgi:hypothetical protein